MSSSKRTVVRAKPKPKAVVTASPAAAPAPAAVPAAPAAEAPAVATATETPAVAPAPKKAPKPHVPVPINASAGRVRRHFDKRIINAAVDKELEKYKPTQKAFTDAKAALESGKITETVKAEDGKDKVGEDGKVVRVERELTEEEKAAHQATIDRLQASMPELEQKIKALTSCRIRFSNRAQLTMAAFIDAVASELIQHAMEHVTASGGNKRIYSAHVHAPGVENLKYYPLVAPLESFKSKAAALAKEAHETELARATEDATKAMKARARKIFSDYLAQHKLGRADAGKILAEEPAAAEPAVAEPAVAEEKASETADKMSFIFYISNICKDAKLQEKYSKVRVSSDIKSYINTLIIELISRIATLVECTIDCMKISTISNEALLKTIKFILIDGKRSDVAVSLSLVPSPTAVAAEEKKKAEAEKAGSTYSYDLESLPKAWVAERKVSHPDSSFDGLVEYVKSHVSDFDALKPTKAKKAAAAPQPLEATSQ